MNYRREKLNPSLDAIGFIPAAAALLGNSAVAAMKFTAFLVSGSSAMFSEAIHSLADTTNQALLVVGVKRSAKKADEKTAYGYGRERFVWALISACGVFFIGAGVTIYKGITAFIEGREIVTGKFIFFALVFALVIETITLLVALREFRKTNKDSSFREALENGDPITIAVLYEDSAAVLGVIIAFVSIVLASYTKNFYWDAAGSILIGMLLGVIAVVLINKNRGFLVAKPIPEDLKEKIIELLEKEAVIERVLDFKSSMLNIGEYRVKCEVEFNGSALLKKIHGARATKQEYELVKKNYGEFIKFCADYIDRVPRLMGKKIDEIEKKIQKSFPGVKHIDIEIN